MTRNNEDIWEFPNTSTKKQRAGWYVPETIQHPAKMPTYLVDKIISMYTKPGDVILDPMGGCGTTPIEAVKNGRNCIVIDYERKFCDLMQKNIDMANKQQTLTPKGKAAVIHGDARNLSSILGNVDQIVFSPPHGDALSARRKGYTKIKQLEKTRQYPSSPDNIGNLKYGKVDSVIMSPPYEGMMDAKRHTDSGICGRDPKMVKMRYETAGQKENIGSFKGQTYLDAMHQVYAECYKVLKKGGYMVLVVKNFIRNKKIVDLAGDTVKLCESVGFKHVRTHKRKLTQLSFWIINYRKRYPDAPKVDFEHVLVFQKV